MSAATFGTHAAVGALTRAGVAAKADTAALGANRRAQGGPHTAPCGYGAPASSPSWRGSNPSVSPASSPAPGSTRRAKDRGRAALGGRGRGGEFHRSAPDRGNRVRPGLQAAPRRAIVAA